MRTTVDSGVDEVAFKRVACTALAARAEEIAIVAREPLKVSQERISVERVSVEVRGRPHSFIVKGLAPEIARRNRLVAERWLPAAGLSDAAPAVLGILNGPDSSRVWLVCADLGTRTLATLQRDPARVAQAVALIATLHRSFADHPLLGEVRLWGGDLGMAFHSGNLRDAIRAIEALAPLAAGSATRSALVERLLLRLRRLLCDAPRRAAVMERLGGPETLLHGDLWLENIVEDRRNASAMRLIDWDHAGVGPALYDVSTFLFRFAPGDRRELWELYGRELGPVLWELPAEPELNLLCETAEHARISNHLIWPALAARGGDEHACFETLAIVEGWFDEQGPALP
jgi:hypothetical protein